MKTTHKRKVSVKGQPRCCQKVRHCKHMKISQKRNAGTRAAHSKPAVFLDTSVYTVQDTPHSFSLPIRILPPLLLLLLATLFLLHRLKNSPSVDSQNAQ